MDYIEFFDLRADPFRLVPDPHYFYPSSVHKEALQSLRYMVEHKEGFFLCTGEPGTGKTTLLKEFLNTPGLRESSEIAVILTPRLSPEEFLLTLLEELKIKTNGTTKNDVLRGLQKYLVSTSIAGKTVIIIVDEAQNLPDDTLEELRLLSNLETDKEKLLQIVLIGQTELREKLLSDNFRQINQRITLRTNLRYLTPQETADYINFRLAIAGKGSVKFSRKAISLIAEHSGGNPRLINLLCTRAMMAAYLDGVKEITATHVSYAKKNIGEGLSVIKKKKTSKPQIYVYVAVMVLLGLVVVYAFVKYGPQMWPDAKTDQIGTTNGSHTVKTEGSIKQDAVATEGVRNEQISPPDQPIDSPRDKIKTITLKGVTNIRAKPDKESLKIGVITNEATVEVIDEQINLAGEKWYKVRLQTGKEGWVRG